MKKCSKCFQTQAIGNFGKRSNTKCGLRSECTSCRYRLEKEYKRIYKLKNKEKVKKYRAEYYIKNKDLESFKAKEYRSRSVNKDKTKKYNRDYVKIRSLNDPLFKLRLNLRKRLNKELVKRKWNKNNKLSIYLGCSLEELKKHIESLFQPGMTWENHGQYGWHIDHKIPLSNAKSEKELYALSHFSNLQPLWALDNLLKGNKV